VGYRRQQNNETGIVAELAVADILKTHGDIVHRDDNNGSPDLILYSNPTNYGIEVKSITVGRHSKRRGIEEGNVRIEKTSFNNLLSFCSESSLSPLFIVELRFRHPIGKHYFVFSMDRIKELCNRKENTTTFALSYWNVYKNGVALEDWKP